MMRNVDTHLAVLRAFINHVARLTNDEEEAHRLRFTGHRALNAVEAELKSRKTTITRAGLTIDDPPEGG